MSEDGKSVGYLALIEKGGFTFSASNGNLSPGETLPSKWALVRNGESVVNGAYLEVRNVSWASDCKHAWYGAATGPYKVERAIDGELMGLFPFSTDPAIGGGGRIAYARLEDRNRWYLVVDGKRVGEFESVASLQFSPDGSQLAVLAKKPNEPRHLYVNNQVRSEFEAAADLIQYAAKIMFSPDGKHLVVHALGALFVDGKRIPEAVSPKTVPVVSPDSRQVVFSAVSPGGKHHLVFYPLKVVPGG